MGSKISPLWIAHSYQTFDVVTLRQKCSVKGVVGVTCRGLSNGRYKGNHEHISGVALRGSVDITTSPYRRHEKYPKNPWHSDTRCGRKGTDTFLELSGFGGL